MDTDPLGKNGNEDKFVIKTITGGTEYIEIPDGADNYEIMVPSLRSKEMNRKIGWKRKEMLS